MIRKEMLLILLCVCLQLTAATHFDSAYASTSPLSLWMGMSEGSEEDCGTFQKTLIQQIQFFRQKSDLEQRSSDRTSKLILQKKTAEISNLEFTNGSQLEEMLQKRGKCHKEKGKMREGQRTDPQVFTISCQIARGEKQELTSLIRHENSKICHMIQPEIKIQTKNTKNSTANSFFTLPSMLVSFASLVAAASAIYKISKSNKKQREFLQGQLSHMQTEKETMVSGLNRQIENLRQKSQFYEIFWDRLITEVHDKKCYDHLIYEGRFLNQQTYVYAVKMQGIDVQTVQRKLNQLLTCSHSRLSKLYFYVRQGQHLLAFTEKIIPLATQQLSQTLNNNASEQSRRNLITQIIETLDYLQAKIELKWLPLHSIQLEYKNNKESPSFDFKINAIPCLFRKMPNTCEDENDTCPEDIPCFVRTNIAALFHLIIMNGKPLMPCQLKKMLIHNDQYVQFFNFILYEARAIGHTHELLFKEVKQHPFLWDTTRKILFISDFSNFIETHLDEHKIEKMEEYATHFNVVEDNWGKPFHFLFAQEINNYRKYDFSSMRDLVRMIRNKLNHFHEIPKEVRAYVGKTPEKFMEYCLIKFPKLLYFAYNYTRKKKWRLHVK